MGSISHSSMTARHRDSNAPDWLMSHYTVPVKNPPFDMEPFVQILWSLDIIWPPNYTKRSKNLDERLHIHIACTRCIRCEAIATYGVGWSVCHIREPCKYGWTDWDFIWGLTWVGPRNHVLDEAKIPHGKGQFWGSSAHSKASWVTTAHTAAEKTITVSAAVYAAKQNHSIVNNGKQ